jgi:hypothetical protein
MTQRIIYKSDDGTIAIIAPTDEALNKYTIAEIAQKDVPSGSAYKIVSVDDIPTDRTFRNAWEIDEALLTDGIGSEHDMFTDDPQHPDYIAPAEEEVV